MKTCTKCGGSKFRQKLGGDVCNKCNTIYRQSDDVDDLLSTVLTVVEVADLVSSTCDLIGSDDDSSWGDSGSFGGGGASSDF